MWIRKSNDNGGIVEYSRTIPLIDGASIVTPSYAPYDKEGKELLLKEQALCPILLLKMTLPNNTKA